MIALIVRRLLLALVTLFIISLIVFLGVEALPGDSATGYLGQFATPESLAALRDEFGLNDFSVGRNTPGDHSWCDSWFDERQMA